MTNVKRLVNMNIDINVNSANSLEDEEFSKSICETYVIDKQNWVSSWKYYIRIIKVDELVHMNLINDDKISQMLESFHMQLCNSND